MNTSQSLSCHVSMTSSLMLHRTEGPVRRNNNPRVPVAAAEAGVPLADSSRRLLRNESPAPSNAHDEISPLNADSTPIKPIKPIELADWRRTIPARSQSALLTVEQALFGLAILLAFVLRIWDVGARAMHLDESTVAWFAWQLLTGHGYAYDPVYHGPFQHEMLALLFLIFEPSQTTARALAVILGTGLVALPWFIRDYLGRTAALLSCFLLAVSPSFVYFGRFERDDTYMEFFTLLLVVFALRFLRDRKPWQFYGAAIAFTLAFATKESTYIVAFILVSYLVFHRLGRWAAARPGSRALARRGEPSARMLAGLSALLALALVVTPALQVYPLVPAVLGIFVAYGVAAAATALPMVRRRTALRPSPDRPVEGLTPDVVPEAGRPASPHASLTSPLWRRHWVNALTIAVGITVLMYSTFGGNLNGVWDTSRPFFNNGHVCPYPLALNLNACRKDILGGLFYWLSQHKVARGGQPWYYYLLIYGLYEQLAILFGLIAVVRTFVSRMLRPRARMFRMFLTYWAVLSLIIYSWAGEKFPWLGIHPLLPITLLAAVGIADVLQKARLPVEPSSAIRTNGTGTALAARTSLVVGAILLVGQLHNTYELNYVNGANPVEMMVYVQSAPDTATDARLIDGLSNRATNANTLPVTIDTVDAWPFAWYLRNMPDVGYPTAAQAVKPPYSTNPVVILDQTDAETFTLPRALTSGYTRTLRRLDWWFPEDYKTWDWPSFGGKVLSPASWDSIWNWEVNRVPFGPRDGTWYYLYLKKGYFGPF
jgi:uncharacterized protein (TIGR03663 family)